MAVDLKPGQQFDHYIIGSELGRGGQAVVYRARQTGTDRDVALKVFDREGDAQYNERFRREAIAAGGLRSPRVVTVYDAGEADGMPFIAMELIEGTSLRERLSGDEPLPPDEALAILADVAEAVDATHMRGLIHRDIKPANVLIDNDGRAYLSDFGIVHATSSLTLTSRGDFLGTVEYVAPEQASGGPITSASDIYSFGALAFETLVGRPPFTHEMASAVLISHVRDVPPEAHELNPALPSQVSPILASALAKDPGERPSSASDIVARLRVALVAKDQTVLPGTRAAAAMSRAQAPPSVAASTHDTPTDAASAGVPGAVAEPAPAGVRSRATAALIVAVVALIIVGAAAAALVMRSSNSGSPAAASPAPDTPTTTTSSPPSSPPPPTETTQARALNNVLTVSSGDRQSLVNAVRDLGECTDIAAATAEISQVASSRSSLINEVSSLDLSQIPNAAQVQSLLTSALQYSVQSDNSYAAWGSDLESGCDPSTETDDSNYQAARSADTEAESTKGQFVAVWNPIASSVGLPTKTDNSF